MPRPSMPSITWQQFTEMLSALQARYDDLSVEQLDILQYLSGYTAYHKTVSPAPSKGLLSLFITTFPPVPPIPSDTHSKNVPPIKKVIKK